MITYYREKQPIKLGTIQIFMYGHGEALPVQVKQDVISYKLILRVIGLKQFEQGSEGEGGSIFSFGGGAQKTRKPQILLVQRPSMQILIDNIKIITRHKSVRTNQQTSILKCRLHISVCSVWMMFKSLPEQYICPDVSAQWTSEL